jgi:POT family proton-dependent oligopeptide transporter
MPQGGRIVTAPGATFFGHPRGLATLFFTEMWERFSYYGMRALLILFMTASLEHGGLGFSVAKAGVIYGLYTAMVYLMSLPGGWLADRIVGQRRAVLYGGILIALGQFSLGIHALPFFYLGLVLLVLGTGLLKPNVSTMVGQLYAAEDHRRDAGFSLFYMGINLGAFFAPLACGYVGQRVNWNLGFVLAGVGMTLGLVQYVLGGKHLGEAGLHPVRPASPEAARRQKRGLGIAAASLVALIGVPLVLSLTGVVEISANFVGNALGVLLIALTVGVFGWLLSSAGWTPRERKRFIAIGVLFLAAAMFWSAYEQAGSTLTLFADRGTDNRVLGHPYPSSWFQSLNSLFVILLAPAFAWLWIRLGKREPSSPAKFALGLVLVGLGFVVVAVGALRGASGVPVSPLWLTATYFLHTCGELCLSPVGLSAMTKLAPARVASLMMGVWFLSDAVGNYIGGRVASFYESFSTASLFAVVAGFAIGVGIVLMLLVKPIKGLMGGVN